MMGQVAFRHHKVTRPTARNDDFVGGLAAACRRSGTLTAATVRLPPPGGRDSGAWPDRSLSLGAELVDGSSVLVTTSIQSLPFSPPDARVRGNRSTSKVLSPPMHRVHRVRSSPRGDPFPVCSERSRTGQRPSWSAPTRALPVHHQRPHPLDRQPSGCLL